MDRTSGSGVLARDPDAILTMTELEETGNAYRLESVLREFPSTVSLSLRWNYPLHKIDNSLDSESLKGGAGRSQAVTCDDVLRVFDALDKGNGASLQEMRDCLGGAGAPNTIKARIKTLEETGRNPAGLFVKGNRIYRLGQGPSTINNPKES